MTPRGPVRTAADGLDRVLADATERLLAEFAGAVEQPTITAVVRACGRDLAGAPAAALPELVERLARQDLRDRTGTRRRA